MKGGDIKKLMILAGISQAEIAERLGITKSLVNHVVSGIRSNQKVRQAIADAVGRSVEELWGDGTQEMAQPLPPSKVVSGQPLPPSKVVSQMEEDGSFATKVREEKEVPKVILSLSEFLRIGGGCLKDSRSTAYRHVNSGKYGPIKVAYNEKKRYYYIEVNDPKIVSRVLIKRKLSSYIKKDTICIDIKVPEEISEVVPAISSVFAPSYKRFFEFIDKKPKEILHYKFTFDEVKYVEKRIRIYKRDYQKLLDISRNNNLSISKVIEMLLRSFVALNFGTVPEEEYIKIKRGKLYYGDMLLTN